MDLSFTEEQEILRKFAKDFLVEKFPKKYIRELEEGEPGYSPDIWKEMAGLGWMGLPFPEEYGGADMTFLDLAVLLEEMGRASMPGPYFSTVLLGTYPIMDCGSEEQKKEFIPKISAGTQLMTMALIEPSGRCNASEVQVKAVKEGDSWVINGTKLFVMDAHIADYILCVARTGNSSKPEEGISIFIVDAKSPGVEIAQLSTISRKFCEVIFKDVKVPNGNVLGEVNKGWAAVAKIIERAEIAQCCEMVGMAQQVLDMTVDYAKERKQFGKPIGTFQIIQHYCADIFTFVEGMRLSTYKAAWMMNEGMPCSSEIAVAKIWAIQAADKIMGLSHQVHAAMGVTIEYDLHYYTRRLKTAELTFGDVRQYSEVVSQDMGL
jgi:alkylation response protein AidB-like acyl-CoA dehydrogenase